MKKLLIAALSLCLMLSMGCGSQGPKLSVIAGPNGSGAAGSLAAAVGDCAVASASSDKAALEQLAGGSCEMAVVTEKQFRDAITGDGEYHGSPLSNVQRLDNLLLGVFAVFVRDGLLGTLPEGSTIAVIGEEGGVAYDLAAQLGTALSAEVLELSPEQAAQRLSDGRVQAVAGLFLPGNAAVKALEKAGGRVVPYMDIVDFVLPARSMVSVLMEELYAGMTRVQGLHLYGVLAVQKDISAELEQRLLSIVAELPIKAGKDIEFDFD